MDDRMVLALHRGSTRRQSPLVSIWGLAAALLVLSASALFVDLPIARWCAGDPVPGDLHKLIMLAEVFGHGSGVLLILLSVAALDSNRRRYLPRLVACAYGAGLVVDVIKLGVARLRPHSFDLSGSVADSFVTWLPLLSDLQQPYGSQLQSFPSAHAATAVGLAFGLSWLYPHGRRLFVLLALLACLQRVVAGDHYLSDTLAGSAVACVVAQLSLRPAAFGQRYRRWEDRTEDPADVLAADAA